jgi:hypothetical protein
MWVPWAADPYHWLHVSRTPLTSSIPQIKIWLTIPTCLQRLLSYSPTKSSYNKNHIPCLRLDCRWAPDKNREHALCSLYRLPSSLVFNKILFPTPTPPIINPTITVYHVMEIIMYIYCSWRNKHFILLCFMLFWFRTYWGNFLPLFHGFVISINLSNFYIAIKKQIGLIITFQNFEAKCTQYG